MDQVKALYSAVRTPQGEPEHPPQLSLSRTLAEAAALRGTDPALVNEVRHLKQMHNKHELTIKGAHHSSIHVSTVIPSICYMLARPPTDAACRVSAGAWCSREVCRSQGAVRLSGAVDWSC